MKRYNCELVEVWSEDIQLFETVASFTESEHGIWIKYSDTLGTIEGEVCNRDDCTGFIGERPVGKTTPTTWVLHCPNCGWEESS